MSERPAPCKFVATDMPRIIKGRHVTECGDDECWGCHPCSEGHCAVCRRTHVAAGTCAECVAVVRDDLAQILTMCDALPEEAEHRGVNGEAMMLLGPTADPEAWRNRAMSAMRGRVDAPYLEDCRDEQHPVFVLGGWEQMWRDHLDQPTDLLATLPRVGAYLGRQMHVMAATEDLPFEDFARDVRGCRGHLQSILHDQNQGDPANIGCFECGQRIERKLTEHGFEDHWTCQGCRRKYTYAEYNFALRAHLEAAKERA